MTRNEELEIIWQEAALKNLCSCNTDEFWGQDITGPIRCDRCHERVSEEVRPSIQKINERTRNYFI